MSELRKVRKEKSPYQQCKLLPSEYAIERRLRSEGAKRGWATWKKRAALRIATECEAATLTG